jgi:hypothetical protein
MKTGTREEFELIQLPVAKPVSDPGSVQGGYVNVRLNAIKHGILSRHAVLPHEDGAEFAGLLESLVEEHQPAGPTEMHLVEELASVMWRQRRVLQAEGASINRGLLAVAKGRRDHEFDLDGTVRAAVPFEPTLRESGLNSPVELAETIRESPEDSASRLAEAEEDLAATSRAVEILRRGGVRAYGKALRVLVSSSRDTWNDSAASGEYAATAEGLATFINDFLLPFCRQAAVDARNHDAIKAQALGEGLQVHRIDKLNRYETHLDRKFERTLAMLLKLKELRRSV